MTTPFLPNNNWENNRIINDASYGFFHNKFDLSFNKGNLDCISNKNDEIFIIWTDVSNNNIKGAYTSLGWNDPSGIDWKIRDITKPNPYETDQSGGIPQTSDTDRWLIGDNVCCCFDKIDSSNIHITYTKTSYTADPQTAQIYYYHIKNLSEWSVEHPPNYDSSGPYHITASLFDDLIHPLTNIKSLSIDIDDAGDYDESETGIHILYFMRGVPTAPGKFMHLFVKFADILIAANNSTHVNSTFIYNNIILEPIFGSNLKLGYNNNIVVDGSNSYISFYGISGENNSIMAMRDVNEDFANDATLFFAVSKNSSSIEPLDPPHWHIQIIDGYLHSNATTNWWGAGIFCDMAINLIGPHPSFRTVQAYLSYWDSSENTIKIAYNTDVNTLSSTWTLVDISGLGDNPPSTNHISATTPGCINTKILLNKTNPSDDNPYIVVYIIAERGGNPSPPPSGPPPYPIKYYKFRLPPKEWPSGWTSNTPPFSLDIPSGRTTNTDGYNEPFSGNESFSKDDDNRGLFSVTNNGRNVYMIYNEFANGSDAKSVEGNIRFVWKRIPQLKMTSILDNKLI